MVSLDLPNNVIYSPLAGCSDYPFRQMVRRYHKGLIFCEMVKIDALVRHDQHSYHILDYDDSMHPIGAQLCGSKISFIAEAARIVEDLGFDVVDLNCGCPVDKVVRDGGSGLLKTPELIGDLLSEMVNAVNIPVTVKVRAGWDDNSINIEKVTQIAEKAGASAIFIHGRTSRQKYKGGACWDYIRRGKLAANKMTVFGNGDVFDRESAQQMMQQTQCDGVLISRGTLGQPWLGEDVLSEEVIERDRDYCLEALFDHFNYVLKYYSARRAVLDARKIGCWYVKNVKGARELRSFVSKVKSVDEFLGWYNTTFNK